MRVGHHKAKWHTRHSGLRFSSTPQGRQSQTALVVRQRSSPSGNTPVFLLPTITIFGKTGLTAFNCLDLDQGRQSHRTAISDSEHAPSHWDST